MRILSSSTVDRQGRIAGIVGSVFVAGLLTSGAVAAHEPSQSPDQGTLRAIEAGPDSPNGAPIIAAAGSIAVGPGGAFEGGACGGRVTITVGPDGSRHVDTSGPESDCGPVIVEGAFGRGTIESVEPSLRGPGLPGRDGLRPGPFGGTISLMADAGRVVTVTSVAGDLVGLETADGWTRELDTANVVITLDNGTLTAADLAVGDKVRVVQVQNANDTWTITGLEVVLPEVLGTVSDVTADGFTVTGIDGARTIVKVSDATTWPQPVLGGSASGLDTLRDGDIVAARGKLADDGSMTARSVLLQASFSIGEGDPGMPVPVPLPAPETPEASPAP